MECLASCGDGQRRGFLLLPQPRKYPLEEPPLGEQMTAWNKLKISGSLGLSTLPSRDWVFLRQRTQRDKTLTSSFPHWSSKACFYFILFFFIPQHW